METKRIKISEVKPSEYNPRKISEKDYNNLKKSVKQFGILRPLIINKITGNLISGHQLLKVLIEEKIEETDALFLELTEEQEKALNLAMNKISGEFEEDKLIELLQQIDEKNQDVLGLTGFNTEEINYLLGLREKDKQNIFAKSQEDQFNLNNKYGIQVGDIVKLDDHLIICGDSTDPENLRKLIGDKKLDLVVTSPPYNLDIKYGKYSDNRDMKDYLNMIEKVFMNMKDYIDKGRFICVNIGREWGPINIAAKYDNIFEGLGYTFFRNIYWSKPKGAARGTITTRNPFPRYYVPKVQTEIIEIYASEEMPNIYEPMIVYKIGEGEKTRKEQIPKILLEKYSGNVLEMMTETQLSQDHPAPFPVQLPYNCIRFFSFEGERIIDPFMGSGSTLIAADQLKRKCYGIELDPSYVSLCIERFMLYKPSAKMDIQRTVDPKEKVL
jgi:DNA modification methylase